MIMAAAKLTEVKSEAFYEIPLNMIIVEEQIRSGIDLEGESFLALKASIAQKGVLEPVLVTPRDGKYLLISGERRLAACRELGLERIPARVLDAVEAREEILCIQLSENFQREDLDPIDAANAMFSYFKARNPKAELDAMMNLLVLYKVDPQRVKEADVSTLDTLMNVSGKSATSVNRMLSLLRLPDQMREAVKKGVVPVTQGYVLAANLNNPGVQEAFNRCLETPMTQAELERLLDSFRKAPKKPAATAAKPKPFAGLYTTIRSAKISLAKSGVYQKADLETLRDEVKTLADLIDQRIGALSQRTRGASARRRKK